MISLIQPMQFIFLIKYLDLTTWNISLRLFYYSFNWASSSLFKSCCLILLMQLHLSYTTWTLYLTAADCLYSSYLDPNTHPSWASIVLYEHKHHKKMFRGLGTFSDCFHLCSISTLVIFFFFQTLENSHLLIVYADRKYDLNFIFETQNDLTNNKSPLINQNRMSKAREQACASL